MAILKLGDDQGVPSMYKIIENSEAGLNAILTIENVLDGGIKENTNTVDQQVVQLIQNFIDGETNNE